MTTTRSTNVPHDPAAEHCGCWSCDNNRRIIAYQAEREKKRAAARAATSELVVEFLGPIEEGSRVDAFRMRIGSDSGAARGPLAEILHTAHPAVAAFHLLDLYQHRLVLEAARAKGLVRVGQLEELWLEEAKETPDGA